MVGEGEEERGNLTPYLDLAEGRRRRPATVARRGGGPAAECAAVEQLRRARSRGNGGGEAEGCRRGGVEEWSCAGRPARLEPELRGYGGAANFGVVMRREVAEVAA